MSDAFERFLKSNFFGNPYNAWHDGLDTPTLTALQGDERAKAEEMLLKMLPDNRAVVGLGEIRSEKAIKPLRKLIHDPHMSTEAAVALHQINGDASGLDSIIRTLKDRGKFWSARMDAAMALRGFQSKAAILALFDALDDPEMLVRYHATNSLLSLYKQVTRDDPARLEFSSTGVAGEQQRAAVLDAFRHMVNEGKLDEL
ncbi:MAG: hypothetical protein U0521_12610 [Anaerolineae bacterium]